jgi:hypothetical protein
MKLAEHNLLSLRCAMTKLGYQWKRDRDDRSLRWERIDHWTLSDSAPGYDFQLIDMNPVCSSGGDLITTDVNCSVRVHSDLSLDGWVLWESWAGTGKDIDPWACRLEDLPKVLNEWVAEFSRG